MSMLGKFNRLAVLVAIFGILSLALAVSPSVTLAANQCETNSDCKADETCSGSEGSKACVKTGGCDSDLECPAGQTCQSGICKKDVFGLNPIDEEVGDTLGNEDLRTTVGRLINVALSMLGIIAVIIILAGGFKWMTAGGNDDKVAEARKMIFSGIIGLAIILSAWAIALFVLNQLNKATSGSTDNIPTID